jgi:hypothetical protein
MRCEMVLRWQIKADNLNMAEVYRRGSHGPNYKFDPKAVRMAPAVRRYLLESDGLDVSSGGNTTAGRQAVLLQERAEKKGLNSPDVAPTRRVIENILGYERRKASGGHGPIVERMQAMLQREHVRKYVIFPRQGDPTIAALAAKDKPFLIVFISTKIRSLVEQYGRHIIGLDGIYKWNKMKWPVWIVTVEDTKGHSWPIAFFFSSQ